MVAVPKEAGSNPTLAHRSGGRYSLDGTKHSVHGGGNNGVRSSIGLWRGSQQYQGKCLIPRPLGNLVLEVNEASRDYIKPTPIGYMLESALNGISSI